MDRSRGKEHPVYLCICDAGMGVQEFISPQRPTEHRSLGSCNNNKVAIFAEQPLFSLSISWLKLAFIPLNARRNPHCRQEYQHVRGKRGKAEGTPIYEPQEVTVLLSGPNDERAITRRFHEAGVG